jgi:hypothetical protein
LLQQSLLTLHSVCTGAQQVLALHTPLQQPPAQQSDDTLHSASAALQQRPPMHELWQQSALIAHVAPLFSQQRLSRH